MGWRDEDLERLGHRLADLPSPLDLDLQQYGRAFGHALLKLGAERPVAVAAVLGVLDELADIDPSLEHVAREEVVVHPIHFARARIARGGGDREFEFRDPVAQCANQRPFADP